MFGLIPLIVLGGIVYAIVRAVQSRSQRMHDEGTGVSTRRLFQYALLFAALMVAASGVSGLLGQVLSDAAARRAADVAFPMAMAVVGVPVFVLLARWGWRVHASDPVERHTVGWSLYLNAALVVALVTAVGSAFETTGELIDGIWNGRAFASVVVWLGVWAMHWWMWRRVQPSILPNLHVWLGSAIGLWVAAVSTALTVDGLIDRAIDAASDGAAVSMGASALQLAIAGIVIGGAVWAWHWPMHGLGAVRTQGWYVYTLLLGVLAGVITVIASVGFAIYVVLEWFVGDPATTSAVTQFQDLSGAAGAAIVGGAVWAYHRSVLGPRAERTRTEIDRVYDYLVAGAALTTVAVAMVILVVAGFEALDSGTAAGSGDSSVNVLLAAVTLLGVGAPLWGVTWQRIQHIAAADTAEVTSGTRRSYLFAVLGTGGAVAFVGLTWLLVLVFEAMFEEGDTSTLVHDIRVPAALLVTTGIAAAYHWVVYRAERTQVAEVPFRDVLLVGDGAAIAMEVGERTHSHVRMMHRVDLPEDVRYDTDAIVAAIQAAEGEHLLVIVNEDGIEVVPTSEGFPRQAT